MFFVWGLAGMSQPPAPGAGVMCPSEGRGFVVGGKGRVARVGGGTGVPVAPGPGVSVLVPPAVGEAPGLGDEVEMLAVVVLVAAAETVGCCAVWPPRECSRLEKRKAREQTSR